MAAPTRYQEVITATNYSLVAEDGTPFPVFLRFDGTDDGMATGNIDFTATDKMSVFAGVRKLSDAATAFLAEFSAASSANNGSFALIAPTSAVADYAFRSMGSTYQTAIGTTFTSPTTNVITGLGNISGDSTILRVNGAQAASNTADQGTGNYGNYPLFIGRRNNSSFSFNGRLYGLTVVGKTASATEISSTEAWLNNKTKAF